MRLAIFFVYFSCCLSNAVSAVLPEEFSASYFASTSFADAESVIALVKSGEYIKYTVNSKVRFFYIIPSSVYYCSLIKVVDNKLFPIEYHYKETGDDYSVVTLFDWDNKNVLIVNKNEDLETRIPFQTEVWDSLSIQVKLIYDFINGSLIKDKMYPVLELTEILGWVADAPEKETIELKSGKYKTSKIIAMRGNKKTTIWLSEEYGYVPLQLDVKDVHVKMVTSPNKATGINSSSRGVDKLSCKVQ